MPAAWAGHTSERLRLNLWSTHLTPTEAKLLGMENETHSVRGSVDVDSLERIVPDALQDDGATGQETLELHVSRYEFAARFVRPGRLLDMACGVGYGTEILKRKSAAQVTALGVDISPDVVDYASKNFATEGLSYRQGDAMNFDDAEEFDTIVSLETIEHLPKPGEFIKHVYSLLKPSGILIASVPTTPSVDANPYHLHDFTERSLRRLFLDLSLTEVDCYRQIQRFNPIPLLGGKEARSKQIRKGLLRYYATHPASFSKRIYSTLRFGFTNHYLTVVWKKS